jgi:uncharacterized protein (DUF1501 family)
MSTRMMYRCIVRSGQRLASISTVAQFDERLREARRENDARENGGHALADALKLQQNTQQRASTPTGRGRRRKRPVIDLDQRTLIKPKRRRALMVLLTIEAAVAFVAVAILIGYLVSHGAQTG